MYFLSLWICRFWVFHINGTIQYVALYNLLLSLSIMFSKVHAYCSMSRFFISFYCWVIFHCVDAPHFVYSSAHTDIWVIFTFWIMLLWTFVRKFLCGWMFLLLLGVYPEVELLNHMITPLFNFWGTTKLTFPKWLQNFTFPPTVYESFCFSHAWQCLLFSVFFILAIPEGVKWYFIVVLICISLMIDDLEHLLYAYWPFVIQKIHVSVYLLGEMSIHIFLPVFNWAICLTDVELLRVHVFIYLFLFSIAFFFFLTSLLEYNCFTVVCWFLLYNKVNQLYVYIYPHIASLLLPEVAWMQIFGWIIENYRIGSWYI